MIYRDKKGVVYMYYALPFICLACFVPVIIVENSSENGIGGVFTFSKCILAFYMVICVLGAISMWKGRREANKIQKIITPKIKSENREIYWTFISPFGVTYITSIGVETYYTKGKFFGLYYKIKDKFKDNYIEFSEIISLKTFKDVITLNLKDGTKRRIACGGNIEAVKNFKNIIEKQKENSIKQQIS